MVEVRRLTGKNLLAAIDDLAQLRMTVFAEWPYLYDGSLEYERNYLEAFAKARGGVLVAAVAEDRIVGCATGSPLFAQERSIQTAFQHFGAAASQVFYFGESVLLPEFRGQGVGHAFFDHREAHARDAGYRTAAFAAVVRSVDHAARPAGYVPLDAFWRKRGYAPCAGVVMSLSWKEHDELAESAKPLQVWTRAL